MLTKSIYISEHLLLNQRIDMCQKFVYLNFQKCKNNLTMHKNSKKMQKNVNFPLTGPENFPLGFLWCLGGGAGAGERGRLVRVERRSATGRQRDEQNLPAAAPHCWLVKKSLEKKCKEHHLTCSSVPKGQMATE